MIRLADLKAAAQEHYTEPLQWMDLSYFGGSSWADVNHHVVSVMVDPPPGNAHIVLIRGGKQEPLEALPEAEGTRKVEQPPLFGAGQMVLEL